MHDFGIMIMERKGFIKSRTTIINNKKDKNSYDNQKHYNYMIDRKSKKTTTSK